MTLYGDMSNRVMTVLRDYSSSVEVHSTDEIFLRLNFGLEQFQYDGKLRYKMVETKVLNVRNIR